MKPKKIIDKFRKEYGHLKKFGLEIHDLGYLSESIDAIYVSTPFIFDNRSIPKKFMGIMVRSGTDNANLPEEFKNIDNKTDYIWAYQRFEIFVEKHTLEIRKQLQNPNMSVEEMLDAICFGDFQSHKMNCIKWEAEGRIPKWKIK